MNKLILPTIRTFLAGAAVLGLLLFLPAWTLNYWQAWVFIVVFMTAVNIIGLYLSIKDPELLERRKNVGPAAEQNPVPPAGSWVGDALVVLGLFINLIVFRENSFGASTVQTMEAQKVITTGPYALVRHPMYAGVVVMMTGVPLALGSYWGLMILAITLPGLVWRILDEEKLLKKDLEGYEEYMQKVRFRLVRYLW